MKAVLFAAGVAALSASAFSTQAQVQTNDINPWKHCGIGAVIFDDNGTAAAVSNIIWDSGTTAVTSATITPETCNSKEISVANFIDTTYDVLVTETAQGRGDHLATALNLVGCEASGQNVEALRAGLRNDMAADLNAATHSDKAYSYYQTLQQTAVACG